MEDKIAPGDIWINTDGFEKPDGIPWDMIDMAPFPKWVLNKEKEWIQIEKGDPEAIKRLQEHWDRFAKAFKPAIMKVDNEHSTEETD